MRVEAKFVMVIEVGLDKRNLLGLKTKRLQKHAISLNLKLYVVGTLSMSYSVP